MNGLSILSTGRSLPSHIMTNEDWSRIVDTDDEWITSRTGIKERHFSTVELNADLAEAAARSAIEKSGISAKDIGLCIVATFTPDYAMPSVSSLMQSRLELEMSTPCFDLNAACSGFIYALKMAQGYLWTTKEKYALIIGSEVISKTLDFSDRSTCVLFGDGAGAVVVEKSPSPFYSVLGTKSNKEALFCPTDTSLGKLEMDGRNVFRFAVDAVPKAVREVAALAGENEESVDYIVCHQANERIIRSASNKLGLPIEKFYMNIEKYGNTSAASIPIALDEMNEEGLLIKGTKLILVGFGAGLTWGSVYLNI